ncbi:MAG: S26 family signal peptidase [Azospirillum sp.]|nr:S26 family signal peptidase [Azospirillum sp.]
MIGRISLGLRTSGRSARVLTLTLAGVALAGVPAVAALPPLLVWNASASVPVGLYRLAPGAPGRDDFVLVRLPEALRALAAGRGYLPRAVPLIKRLKAAAGDSICAAGSVIFINGRPVAERLARDARGRPLPVWRGCRMLVPGEVFLLGGPSPASFDGRYFGPLPAAAIIGRLVPLWID